MGEHQCRPLHLLNDVRDSECFTATGNAKQYLVFRAAIQSIDKLPDRLRLIAFRRVFTCETELHGLIIPDYHTIGKFIDPEKRGRHAPFTSHAIPFSEIFRATSIEI